MEVTISVYVSRFSTLQRVETAEIPRSGFALRVLRGFQYSSTSRNC